MFMKILAPHKPLFLAIHFTSPFLILAVLMRAMACVVFVGANEGIRADRVTSCVRSRFATVFLLRENVGRVLV